MNKLTVDAPPQIGIICVGCASGSTGLLEDAIAGFKAATGR
ncbi:hypothetical protein [Actinacidiphila bryophytorum]|nr:hypothetical protein [Actinacidiphila bryophytorum]